MRLFKKKKTSDQNDIVYEKWHTSFSMFQEHRFAPEMSGEYFSEIEQGNLKLELKRKNLFAWTDDPLYRYDNFVLTAVMGIDPENGYSSAGLLFRRIDDLSYYYFLISNKGHYRLDMVMNGMPSVLTDWTACPDFDSKRFSVTILADGSSLSLYLNGKWIGDASGEGLSAGRISFAGQNYDESEKAVFTLNNIEIESRPARIYAFQAKMLPSAIPAETRLLFAESQMRSGHYPAALIEIKRVLQKDPENTDALMRAADCCINLEMYTEAAEYLDQVALSARDEGYYLQCAGILYMTNDFIALRDMLREHQNLQEENPAAANLLGNAEYSLGNWSAAATAYQKAFTADETQAKYAFNAARAFEKSKKLEEAAVMYGNSARLYFRHGEYEELAGILPFLEKLDESGIETLNLRAKLLFQNNDFKEANKIFSGLIKKKTADSTVYYLNALIEARDVHPRKAVSSFKKAAELEPDYYLYHFKYAEYQFLSGGQYQESLQKALKLAPGDPWVLNLAGLVLLEEGKAEEAAEYFRSASEASPEENEIIVNHSEALFLSGRTEEALSLLSGKAAEVLNQRGNIHVRVNNYELASADYEAALSVDKNNTDIILNLAAACIETDSFSRAEELLVRILEYGDNAQAYNLMGNLSTLKGEYKRAEAAYRKAVDSNPDFIDAVCNLAELFMSRERLNEADLLLSRIRVSDPGERYTALKDLVFRKRMNIYSCSSCNEEWIVPKKTGVQPALKLVGEPPDNMPAGKCPDCGKIFCIGCAKDNLINGRLACMDCGVPLKLSEDWMRYLYHQRKF